MIISFSQHFLFPLFSPRLENILEARILKVMARNTFVYCYSPLHELRSHLINKEWQFVPAREPTVTQGWGVSGHASRRRKIDDWLHGASWYGPSLTHNVE